VVEIMKSATEKHIPHHQEAVCYII